MSNIGKILGNAAIKVFKGFVVEKHMDPFSIKNEEIKSILIVVRHQMGDMLCSLPMMFSVRHHFPEAHITLVTKNSTKFKEIFRENNPPVDEVRNFEYGFESFVSIAKELKDKRPDLAIVPSSVSFSATNHMFAYFSNAKYRIGVSSKDYEVNKTGYLLNIKNDFLWELKKVHQIERNLDVIRQLNIEPAQNRIRLTVNQKCSEYAENYFAENFQDKSKLVFGFHTGAGKEQNVWTPSNYAQLAIKLNEKFHSYFFISNGPSDAKYVKELESLLKGKVEYSIGSADLNIMNNAAIINKVALFISNDTGIMHLASGFDVPQIALFGPTNAWEWGIVGKKKVSIQSNNDKINSISVDTVFETVMTLLNV